MNYSIKKVLTRIRRIIQNPKDCKLLIAPKRIPPDGILIVIHESQELGASLLALHTAEEMIRQGKNVYIVSRQFGKLNTEYQKIAPTQIALSKSKYQRICRMLCKNGYNKALMVTASTGDLVKTTKECGFEVVSMIHELGQVIEMLHLEKATNEMLECSDKVLFSTSIAKKQILELCDFQDSEKIVIRPQGIYYKKPSEKIILEQKEKLLSSYPMLDGKKIIVGIGNTSERKGFDIFLQTAKLLPQYEFVWAGKKENYYDMVVQKIGLPENFVYLGSMNSIQLSGVYSLADVYLMCSRFDTLPSTIFESLIFSTPVIGSIKSGGIVDVIDDKNGYLTEEAECAQFANAIEIVLHKEFKIDKLGNSFEDYVRYVIALYGRIK